MPTPDGASRDICLLASRLLAAEIDPPLYRTLVTAGPPLVDEPLLALGEERAVEELAVEFCRLFVGPEPACSPYESVQRGEATLGGRAERRITDFMARHGVEPVLPPDFPVLTHDHLAVELALLHRLWEADATASQTAAAQELLETHLLPWVPVYLRELGSTARLAPYRAVARLTESALSALNALPDTLR